MTGQGREADIDLADQNRIIFAEVCGARLNVRYLMSRERPEAPIEPEGEIGSALSAISE
jgi:hypothetical protein